MMVPAMTVNLATPMNTLIIKLGATGDVVRTTTLLRRLAGSISWITATKNLSLLAGVRENLRWVAWEDREQFRDRAYDLVINLEDTVEIGQFLQTVEHTRVFGAYLDDRGELVYPEAARGWFDLSLISRLGKAEADRLKLLNRRTYQDLIFTGLGWQFAGERYVLPAPVKTSLVGDVALSTAAGPVWPMKNWAYYDLLKAELEALGLKVNVLPERKSLLEHLGDVAGHRCLVSGDSLPMHLALGAGVPCITLFTCTSPWEIHDYGIQRKIISPVLAQFYYQRGMDPRATTAIPLAEVLSAVKETLALTPA